jgi:hypothetical protein
VLSGAPCDFAICAAVLPLPYRFDTSGFAPTVVCVGFVPCAVALLGFTPAADVDPDECDDPFACAGLDGFDDCVAADCCVGVAVAFFT